jgi:hypothetical protein
VETAVQRVKKAATALRFPMPWRLFVLPAAEEEGYEVPLATGAAATGPTGVKVSIQGKLSLMAGDGLERRCKMV